MTVKFEYTGKLSDGRYFDTDSTKRVTIELDDNDLSVNEMLEEFMNFMKAIGYNFDLGDHLEVVNDFKLSSTEQTAAPQPIVDEGGTVIGSASPLI